MSGKARADTTSCTAASCFSILPGRSTCCARCGMRSVLAACSPSRTPTSRGCSATPTMPHSASTGICELISTHDDRGPLTYVLRVPKDNEFCVHWPTPRRRRKLRHTLPHQQSWGESRKRRPWRGGPRSASIGKCDDRLGQRAFEGCCPPHNWRRTFRPVRDLRASCSLLRRGTL